jgi:hypothetical protein
MADSNPVVAATPYPFYATGQDSGDDSFQAALVSHSGASVERNQDAQFGALRTQHVHRDVEAGKRETVQAKFDLVVAQKDAEIRNADRFASIEKQLAGMKADALQRDIGQLREDKLMGVLDRILAKLP